MVCSSHWSVSSVCAPRLSYYVNAERFVIHITISNHKQIIRGVNGDILVILLADNFTVSNMQVPLSKLGRWCVLLVYGSMCVSCLFTVYNCLVFSPFVITLLFRLSSSFLPHVLSLLLAHSHPLLPSLQPPPKTQIKGMMQTPCLFLMLDPCRASQLASGPWEVGESIFL